jgi:hypothetical protein
MAASLDEFLDLLRSIADQADLTDFCRKHVLHGMPFVFDGRDGEFYEFRKRIAEKYSVSYEEVYITGSAKLGFSPIKRTVFDYDSDIDVAIASQTLFDEFLETVREYQMNLRSARRTVSSKELEMYHEFLEYMAIGWIRPDKLPLSFQVRDLKTDWFEFFATLSHGRSEVGNYKVSAGVFRSSRHLELYTISGIQRVRESITINTKSDDETD